MRKDIIEKLATLLTAAFGLVAALAWNDAIKAVFAEVFGPHSNVQAMLTYAFVVTIVGVFATIWIGNVAKYAKR